MERRKRNLNFLYFRRIKKKAIPSFLNGSINLGWKLEFVRVRVRIQAHNPIKIQLIFFRVQPTERLGWTRNLIGLHFCFSKNGWNFTKASGNRSEGDFDRLVLWAASTFFSPPIQHRPAKRSVSNDLCARRRFPSLATGIISS